MAKIFYKVAKQSKSQEQGRQPELFLVEDSELSHFLHEQMDQNSVLVFDEMPIRNLYTEVNQED